LEVARDVAGNTGYATGRCYWWSIPKQIFEVFGTIGGKVVSTSPISNVSVARREPSGRGRRKLPSQ
jgi:hypothetical protein